MSSRHYSTAHSDLPNAGRRRLLRNSAALAAAFGTASLANLALPGRPAYAADYKALVCVFLFGGNDGMNMVIPIDVARNGQYTSVRAGLAIPRASLLDLPGVQFGLHPSMAGLMDAARAGQLAPVFNVGPLASPLTKAQYRAGPTVGAGGPVPDNLFSHSHQQMLWETAAADAQQPAGWGARASDALATANPVIAIGSSPRFGLSTSRVPLTLQNPGDVFGAYNLPSASGTGGSAAYRARRAALDTMLSSTESHALTNAHMKVMSGAFGMSDRIGPLVQAKPGEPGAVAAIDAAFAPLTSGGNLTTGLAKQLYQVAKLISANATVGGNRQIFFTSLGGFDTHAGQVTSGAPTTGHHADLLKVLADSLGAFWKAMDTTGLGNYVTTFTQSDFGRTFLPNSSLGTDHAWGNNHLVMGGAVRGGSTYGAYPDLTLGGVNDVGVDSWERQGRWIPTTSVDQYASTLLAWFGASDGQLNQVLPNLNNYASARNLGFV